MALSIGFRDAAVGIELGRANCRWRVTSPALSVAGWVHSSTVATFPEAPPIIPDGRISQVRFETRLSAVGLSRYERLKRWFVYAPSIPGLPQASSPGQPERCAGFIKPATHTDEKTAKCPESLCPLPVLPPAGRRVPPPERTLLLRHRSYGLM